jgi:hypothetical protein
VPICNGFGKFRLPQKVGGDQGLDSISCTDRRSKVFWDKPCTTAQLTAVLLGK